MSTSPSLTRYPSIADRVVYITGGATGIGASLVEAFMRQGALTAFIDIDTNAAADLCIRLQEQYGAAPLFMPCDVRDLDALKNTIERTRTTLGDITTLVNNAAHDERHDYHAVTPEYWEQRLEINLRPYFFAIQAVAPHLKRQDGGSIINFSSISWKIKASNYPLYAMCKAAAHGLTRSMARELGIHKIRINTVTPGWVMTKRQLENWVTPDSELDINRNQCLPGRVMAEDVAAMVLFLAADDSKMCTAQEFVVDAGWT